MTLDDSWMRNAACRGVETDIFYAKRNKDSKSVMEAKAICNDCPVQMTCLTYAIAHGIHYGIWGGKEERERRRIPAAQKREARQTWFREHPTAHRMAQFAGPYLGGKGVQSEGGEK